MGQAIKYLMIGQTIQNIYKAIKKKLWKFKFIRVYKSNSEKIKRFDVRLY